MEIRIRDTIVAGALGGLLGSMVEGVLHYLSFVTGLSKSSTLHITQRVIMHQALPLTGLTLVATFIGFVGFGALFGVVLAYIFQRAGTDYAYIKGAGFGLLTYFVLNNFIAPLVQPDLDIREDAQTNLVFFALHVIYGLVTAHVILRVSHREARG
ncbi:MAG: DUF6789 family protein [Bacillota bacterium]